MVFRGHKIIEALQRRLALVATTLDPVDGDTDRGATNHRQVQDRRGMAHPTAVFAPAHIQTQMQSVLDAPLPPVGLKHHHRRERSPRSGAQQPFGFHLRGLLRRRFALGPIDETRQPCGLLHEGETDFDQQLIKGRALLGADQTDRDRIEQILLGGAQVGLVGLRHARTLNECAGFVPLFFRCVEVQRR